MWDTRTTEKSKDVDWDGDNFDSDEPVKIFSLSKSHHDSVNSFMVAGGSQSNELKVFNQDYKAVANITDVSRSIFTTDISHHADSFLFAGGDGLLECAR